MIAPALLAAIALAATDPDPGQPVKDCALFEARYRALLQHQAELDAAAERKPGDPVPPVAEHVAARTEAGQVAGEFERAVARACRRASGSQYECVTSATAYDDLADCALPGLPVLPISERRDVTVPAPPPPTAVQRAQADRTVLREYVRSGTVDLEALGTGTAAANAEPAPPAAASEGQ